MKHISSKVLLIFFWALGVPGQTMALEVPRGPAILEIAGNIQEKNIGEMAVFDRHMLESLDSQTTVTSTPWDEGRIRFEGVPM